jgi:spoIIIJ-associated protein
MPKAILARRSPTPVAPPEVREPAHESAPRNTSQRSARAGAAEKSPARPAVAEPAMPLVATPRAVAQDTTPEVEEAEDEQPAEVRADPALVAEAAVEVVRELILRVGLDAQATVRSAGNPVVIDVMGEDLGLLIGRHGDTLGAFQYLVNSIVGKRVHRWCKVVIDVEHYRLRREDTLRSLANRQAARVRQTHQELIMEPMPAAERRIIHLTLQNSPWVVTHSKGEEPNRSVVIGLRPAER